MTQDDGPLYADRPTVEVAVEVRAPVERVWALVADIALPARFSEELQDAQWLDAPAPGARFVGTSAHPAIGSWQTTSTVVELTPPRAFAYAVGDPAEPAAVWTWLLEPLPDGGTRLVQRAQIGPGWSGLSPAIAARPDKERRIVAGRLREHQANMRRTCEGIKALAEGG